MLTWPQNARIRFTRASALKFSGGGCPQTSKHLAVQISSPLLKNPVPGGGRGVSPYSGLYGEAPPERGTFLRLQVYKRVGIS